MHLFVNILFITGLFSAINALPLTVEHVEQLKLDYNSNITRNKRYIEKVTGAIKDIFEITKIEEEKKVLRTQVELNKVKIDSEKENLKSLQIENKYKDALEKTKVEIEKIMLDKEKEYLQTAKTKNKYDEEMQKIRVSIEHTKLHQIEEAKRTIISQRNRLERRINKIESELTEFENELNLLKMEKSEENTEKIKQIKKEIDENEQKIEKIGENIIYYSRLSFTTMNNQ